MFFSCVLSLLNFLFVSGAMAVAPNLCPQVQDTLEKACHQTPPDLCELRDELMFRKLIRMADRLGAAERPQFEKYNTSLKGPPVQKTLKDLSALEEEIGVCVMQTHSLWTLLLKQGATKSFRRNFVINLIKKKLLATDLYSFTIDSLKQRVTLIQESMAFDLVELTEDQAREWKEFIQSFRQEKNLNAETVPHQNVGRQPQPAYSEKSGSEKVRPAPIEGESGPDQELAKKNATFVKIRQSHQKINEIFQ